MDFPEGKNIELYELSEFAYKIEPNTIGDTDYVRSPIGEYIVLECAAKVAKILNDNTTAQMLRQEYTDKLKAELQ